MTSSDPPAVPATGAAPSASPPLRAPHRLERTAGARTKAGGSAPTTAATSGVSAPAGAASRSGEPAAGAVRRRRPGQTLQCAWCGKPKTVAKVGRTPKYCSDTCRHRAWESRRATREGAVEVRVVDRTVEVAVPVTVTEQVEVTVLPKGAAWAPALSELARQIDAGRVYDRDLQALSQGLTDVLQALERRPGIRKVSSGLRQSGVSCSV